MKFGDLLKKIKRERPGPKDAPKHWIKCNKCNSIMYYKEIAKMHFVCPKCGNHMRITANKRIELLSDEGTFKEEDVSLSPTDPILFVDKKSYKQRIEDGFKKTGRKSSVISGSCKINDVFTQLVVFDFAFMGGSLGSVEGEKIVRAVNRPL